MQEGDPESSTGLSRALFIQCSQLSGHIAILLRCLRVSLITAIDANVKISQAAQKVTGQQLVTDLSSSPLLSGLLIVGRLAWLLKIRGRFLEEALIPAPVFSPQSSSESGAAMIACTCNSGQSTAIIVISHIEDNHPLIHIVCVFFFSVRHV